LRAIRAVAPKRLYVAADGPRSNSPDDYQLCQQTRRIVDDGIDWPCTVFRLYRNHNLSLDKAVSQAITWFFDHEAEGIILEDDCVPHPSFFQFCAELLEFYRNDKRIMCITGNNFQYSMGDYPWSYYFSKYNHCWGWASWRRAWDLFDERLSLFPDFVNAKVLDSMSSNYGFSRYWKNIFKACFEGRISPWDYRWTFACWAHHGLTCTPKVNLVTNIGFVAEATHTTDSSSPWAKLPSKEIELPLRHPPGIWVNERLDNYVDQAHFGIASSCQRLLVRNIRRHLVNMPNRLLRNAYNNLYGRF